MLIYIAGPYRPYQTEGIEYTTKRNIAQARAIAIEVWHAGYVAICPHLNTANFEEDSGLPDERYLKGDLEILRRCDAVVLTPDWQHSKGASAEVEFAKDLKIPIWVYPELPPKERKHDFEALPNAMRRDLDTGAIALYALCYCIACKKPDLIINWLKRHWNQISEPHRESLIQSLENELQRTAVNSDVQKDWENLSIWMKIPF